jgi:hypothetical protein
MAGRGDDEILSAVAVAVSGQTALGGPGSDRIEIQGGDDVGGLAVGAGGNDILTCIGGQEGCLLDGGGGADQLISRSDTAARMDGGPGRDRFTAGPESEDHFLFARATPSRARSGT